MSTLELIILSLLLIWSAAWKAVALWKAAQNNQRRWFIALFLINTLGILEILYIRFWQSKSEK